MKFLSWIMAAMLLGLFIACNHNKKSMTASVNKNYETQDQMVGVLDSGSFQSNKPQEPPPPAPDAGQPTAKVDWDKKIIKNSSIKVEVKDYNEYNRSMRTKVKDLGGYIAQEEQTQSEYQIENVVIIKVPVDQFENAVTELTTSVEKVIERRVSSDDVTAEMVDTKSRMEAKKKVRERYLEMLKQAKNMEEVLQVQKEINDIQEQVESATGRINFLGHSAAYSTINIRFYQVLNPAAGNPTAPSYSFRITSSFKEGLKLFGDIFIMIVALWPLWFGVGVLWVILKRLKPSYIKKS